MILVNRQLRVGLFKLGDLEKRLQESKQLLIPLKKERAELEKIIKDKESEFKLLEKNVIALRSRKFVIRSGQSLIIAEINSSNKEDIESQIEKIIINANKYAYKIVKPKSKEIRNLLLLRKNHIEEIQNTILNGGNWVINIKSVMNVMIGENFFYAFPEITENKIIVRKGEKITKIDVKQENFNKKDIGDKLNFLISSSLAEVKRRGSLTNEIKLRSESVKELRDFLNKNDKTNFELEAVSIRNSKTAQPVIIELNINYLKS
tara:strand:- start:427 stop:1212 length:786 start_codon:yes stop_codon:yes gene_type:complete